MSDDNFQHYTRVEFKRFKAFKKFNLDLKHLNILVGPNNAGKSTVLTAFRILSAGLRRANSYRPEIVNGPNGDVSGYKVDISAISVASENIFYNYEEAEGAEIVFHLSNRNTLTLYFPPSGGCNLIPNSQKRLGRTVASFKANFSCPIGFVPILGPVEHREMLYEKDAARRALLNYTAARNFRNIWYYYPERFKEFQEKLSETWPGMEIKEVEVSRDERGKSRLYMYCSESRIDRELFWSGFGFQVWCQMLTHIIQSQNVSIFLIDEPDIYLHSELQRQLLTILRNLGPDIIVATHSTEIVTEAQTDELVLINKTKRSSKRLKNPSQLGEVFDVLGSSTNPILSQLAKTRRVLFVEGKDFQILGKFAQKLGQHSVGNRRDFAVVPIEGFNPKKARILKKGMETALGTTVISAAILDKDYRSEDECKKIEKESKNFCDYVTIHKRKEIENFLLQPEAIDRAISRKIKERFRRTGKQRTYNGTISNLIDSFASDKKNYVSSQMQAMRLQFERSNSSGNSDATINELVLNELEKLWDDNIGRRNLIPGKDALKAINNEIREKYEVNITPSGIIDAMTIEDIPDEMKSLVDLLVEFSEKKPSSKNQQ